MGGASGPIGAETPPRLVAPLARQAIHRADATPLHRGPHRISYVTYRKGREAWARGPHPAEEGLELPAP